MHYIQRDLEVKLQSFLASDNGEHIILLSGARQTGKSTLIENFPCTEKKTIINLWDEERGVIALRNAGTFSEFEHILKTIFHFTPAAGSILIIDEAQASECISSFIMEMHRKWRGQKVILLGSLLANLYKKGQPMPVGRTVEFICRPLNFSEFLRFGNKEELLETIQVPHSSTGEEMHLLLLDEYRKYLQIGGLPGIVSAYYENREMIYLFESLLNNLYRDADRFIEPEGIRSGRIPQYGRILETVMQAIAHHTGSPTQNTTLLSSDSPAYRTVLPNVLEALTCWHLAYTLQLTTAQYSSKKGYSSKKYLLDCGIANFLLTRLMPVQFGAGNQAAAMLLENAVLQDCISCVESVNAIHCYRSSNRVPSELDFVVHHAGKIIPIEVKSSAGIKLQTLSQLVDYLERNGMEDGYVVYTGLPEVKSFRGKTIHCIAPYEVVTLIRSHSSPRFPGAN